MRADLHMHSVYSDGTETIEFIEDKAKILGLSLVSITDHDTVEGVEKAIEYGKKIGLNVVAGTELSSNAKYEVHVLGYYFDYKNPSLVRTLDILREQRIERAKEIVFKLNSLGLDLNAKDIEQLGVVGRPHIAQLMIKKGFVASVNEAFDKYLGANGVAYVPSKRLSPKEAVELIKKAGGFAVIAHPKRLMELGVLDDLILGLKKCGLDGLECYYPAHTELDVQKLLAVAQKYSLLVTGGSDFHGDNKAAIIDGANFNAGYKLLKAFNIK